MVSRRVILAALALAALQAGCSSRRETYSPLELKERLTLDEARPFSEGRAAARVGERWGFIDAWGRWVVKPRFAAVRDFREGFAAVGVKWGDLLGPMDNGTQVLQEEGVFTIREGGLLSGQADVLKWGFIDLSGRVVAEASFDGAWSFSEGLARVSFGREEAVLNDDERLPTRSVFLGPPGGPGKRGYVDATFTYVIPPKYDYARAFASGVAWVGEAVPGGPTIMFDKLTGRYRLIDRKGAALTDWVDQHGGFSEGLAAARKGELWGYVDAAGKWALPPRFGCAGRFSGGRAWVMLRDGRDGFIDRAGSFAPWTFTAEYWDDEFTEGRMCFQDNVTRLYGFADTTGRVAIAPQFPYAAPFSEGLALVRDAAGKVGYCDPSGKLVIPCAFDDGQPFSEGLAGVSMAGRGWGYIDRKGSLAIEHQFDDAESFREGFAVVGVVISRSTPTSSPVVKWGYIDRRGSILSVSRP